jgi:hypothetical protein
MPTFQRCPPAVEEMAKELLRAYEPHQPLLNAKVKIDFVFAFGDRDDQTGRLLNDALRKNGIKALGIARKISLKDRALGRGDAEIAIDGDHWEEITVLEQRALLDHELHHLTPKTDNRGVVLDDLGRPLITLRKHDVDVGWFSVIAARHQRNSIEQQQATSIMDQYGQYFWPLLCGQSNTSVLAGSTVTIAHGNKKVSISGERFTEIAREAGKA